MAERTVKDILDSLTEEQRHAVSALIAAKVREASEKTYAVCAGICTNCKNSDKSPLKE